MAKGVAAWSQTAANNATGDSTINWAEGMAPSAVNDSARAMMASVAYWRDDISGAIATGGSSTAYTVSSYQSFASLSALANQMVAFTPHTSNTGAACTLNVDSLGAKALRSAPNVELPAGTLVQGTPYVALYNNSDTAFYLQGFFGNPYSIPVAGVLPYFGATAPNSSFVLPYGQAISRATYSSLFSLIGTTHGSGDGSTTFNVPDLRGRTVAGKDDMGGSAASRLTSTYFGTSAAALGAVGGLESHTLTVAQLPTGITSNGSVSTTTTPSNVVSGTISAGLISGGSGANFQAMNNGFAQASAISSTGTASVTSNNTSGGAHNNVQPTLIGNYIMRII